MLSNANSGHSHCKAGGNCGGHAWSRDGVTWSETFMAFGPTTRLSNGSTVALGFVERPQVHADRPMSEERSEAHHHLAPSALQH